MPTLLLVFTLILLIAFAIWWLENDYDKKMTPPPPAPFVVQFNPISQKYRAAIFERWDYGQDLQWKPIYTPIGKEDSSVQVILDKLDEIEAYRLTAESWTLWKGNAV